MISQKKIAVVGAGIYGATVAIRLAAEGYKVSLYDPLGIMCGASVINQFRIHRGYHYPHSAETIIEILEAGAKFVEAYREAIVNDVQTYYAIPHEGSHTSPEKFEAVCEKFSLPLKNTKPEWMNSDFIARCYRVDESIYDPSRLKAIIKSKLAEKKVLFIDKRFEANQAYDFDYVIYATYGSSGSHTHLFKKIRLQVAEKMLIKLPSILHKKSLVVIDGPFTAFDPYGDSEYSQFGSAKYTNHWTTADPEEPIPEKYRSLMNASSHQKVDFTNFQKMVDEAKWVVPLCEKAEYLGSRFTLRLVEDDPTTERRVLRISRPDEKIFHIFSGKVVSAVKAADMIQKMIQDEKV